MQTSLTPLMSYIILCFQCTLCNKSELYNTSLTSACQTVSATLKCINKGKQKCK